MQSKAEAGAGTAGRELRKVVYICYRRSDSGEAASLLYNELRAQFGDVARRPTENLVQGDSTLAVDRLLSETRVMLVVIGSTWTAPFEIKAGENWPPYELEAALLDANLTVVPILLRGAKMPSSEELPSSISALSLLDPLYFDPESSESDVGRIAKRLALLGLERRPAEASLENGELVSNSSERGADRTKQVSASSEVQNSANVSSEFDREDEPALPELGTAPPGWIQAVGYLERSAEDFLPELKAPAVLIASRFALASMGLIWQDAESPAIIFPWGSGDRRVDRRAVNVRVVSARHGYALLELAQSSDLTPLEVTSRLSDGESWSLLDLSDFPETFGGTPEIVEGTASNLATTSPFSRPTFSLPVPKGVRPREGTPLICDGRLAGFVKSWSEGTSGDSDTVLASPVLPAISDPRIRDRLELPPVPLPSIWVNVVGGSKAGGETLVLAGAIGSALGAAEDVGLVIGGRGATDTAVTAAFENAALLEQRSPRIQVMLDDDSPPPEPFSHLAIERGDNWVSNQVERSQLIIILDGGPSCEWIASTAWEAGVAVFAMPRVETTDSQEIGAFQVRERALADWEGKSIPGIERSDYERSKELSIDEQADLLTRIIEAMRRGAERSSNPVVFENDGTGGEDLLNLETQATIFAQGMVSKNLDPPLAIGLFGDWGSGKSHFMGLMESAANKIASEPESWSEVCHIKFNAWHYMDSSLWASLAGKIFDDIARHLDKKELTDYAGTRRKLRQNLQSTRDAKKQARDATSQAVEQLESIRRDMEKFQSERKGAFRTLKETLSSPAFLKKLAELKIEPKRATKAAKRLGLNLDEDDLQAALAAPEELQEAVADLHAMASSATSLVRSITPSSLGDWLVGGALMLLPLFGAVLLGLKFPDTDLLGPGVLAELGAIASSGMLFMRRHAKAATTFLDYARKIKDEGAAIRAEVAKKDSGKALAAYDRAKKDAAAASAREHAIDLSITALQGQLDAINAGRLVYEFVNERSSESGSYRTREGIVSTVRRDLEMLKHLLAQWDTDVDEVKEPKVDADGSLETPDLEKLKVQRIILYIDDLDRCPPERVVEVLQAVQLLLAFDLFVVVVGVDARWLERSLELQFSHLLGSGNGNGKERGGASHHRAASAQDYLEKIFQIPFTLPGVQQRGFETLIEEHLPTEERAKEQAKQKALDREKSAEKQEREVKVQLAQSATESPSTSGTAIASTASTSTSGSEPARPTDPEAPTSSEGTPDPAAAPMQASSSLDLAASAPKKKPDGRTPTTPARGDPGANHQAELRPSDTGKPSGGEHDLTPFHIERWEQKFLTEQLHEFMTTPRLIKRFVNIYRLLRKDEAASGEAFLKRTRDAEFRVVQVLLAMTTGYPRLASELLRRLTWPEDCADDQRFADWGSFLESLAPGSSFALAYAKKSPGLEQDATDEIARLHASLEGLGPHIPENLDAYTRWAPIVGRYSMYWTGRRR